MGSVPRIGIYGEWRACVDVSMVRYPICTSTATLSHRVYGQVNHASPELGSPLVSLSVRVPFCPGSRVLVLNLTGMKDVMRCDLGYDMIYKYREQRE